MKKYIHFTFKELLERVPTAKQFDKTLISESISDFMQHVEENATGELSCYEFHTVIAPPNSQVVFVLKLKK